MSSYGSDPIIHAVAVPVPDDDKITPLDDFRSQMKKKKSSYMLPKGYSTRKIVDDNAIERLKEQGYTNGELGNIDCLVHFLKNEKLYLGSFLK